MNPILLKPESDQCSQVIVQGQVWGKYDAREYFKRTQDLLPYVCASYDRLASAYEIIVIEGAGSAAEMNLRDRDLANWTIAAYADAPVILVADIDRGGIFAQVIGTIDLLSIAERRRVAGIIVNKFRGDSTLFEDGIAFMESRTGLPVLGLVPFLRDLELDQEDRLDKNLNSAVPFTSDTVNVVVTLLPRMSNFTDFKSLAAESDVTCRYAAVPSDLVGADVVILPGSKNTIADLEYLRRMGFPEALTEHVNHGGELVGVCGGYQMLGRKISDPYGVEGGGQAMGLGFLDVITELLPRKRMALVDALPLCWDAPPGTLISGYEIHMGQTVRGDVRPCFHIVHRSDLSSSDIASLNIEESEDGACHEKLFIWGTYIHGVFDGPAFRRQWLNLQRHRKGLLPLNATVSEAVSTRLASALDRWADHLEQHLDLSAIVSVLGLPAPRPK
jgi:adenosylcobyric acid synthase